MILAGDIGGTHTRMAAFEAEGNKLHCVVEKVYKSQEHAGLPEIVSDFTRSEGIPVRTACFGVAGPVWKGRSRISNLPWIIDSRELAQQLTLTTVGLLNDLEAYAYGIDALEGSDFVTLNAGSADAEGNAAVISAGTGLGEAGLYWDGFRHHPFACEGGHNDFAPTNDTQIALLQYLKSKHAHVSFERILSGPGIKNVYDFLRDTLRAEEPEWLRDEMAQSKDAPALISRVALEGRAAICEDALSTFVSVYGTETGNCALKFMSTGGIFIGGSIAAKILPKMKEPVFMQAFLNKGRMSSVLESMPVKVVLSDDAGLIGAARWTLIQKAFGSSKRATSLAS